MNKIKPIAILLFACAMSALAENSADGTGGGPTSNQMSSGQCVIGSSTLTATFQRNGGTLRLARLQSPLNGLDQAWNDPNLFSIRLSVQSQPLMSSAMKLVSGPKEVVFAGTPAAARLSERLPGRMLCATFADEATGLTAQWSAIMTDGANYLRQEIKLRATRGPLAVDAIEMVRANLPGATVAGYTDGSPITTDKLFLGVEHPMAENKLVSAENWTPAEMQARTFDVPVVEIAGSGVRARFDYQHGNHRINIARVSLVTANGKVLAEDVHAGFSGNAASKNNYSLSVPVGVTAATLRVVLGGVASETDSWGKITVTGAKIAGSASVVCSLPRRCELKPDTTWTVASGIGVYPAGQLRRAFLCYLERERAHPYRQYWHYNSWYDLNIGHNDNPDPLKRMTEAQSLDVIRVFGVELHDKRGVGLNGFVWDDGWDDWNSLWQFHQGFPNGFAKLKAEAAQQEVGMGAWLSPWGGYGGSHDMRVKFGKAQGYETNPGGFSLGGPKYFAAFRDTCLKMIRDNNVSYFKFDGIGGGMYATGAPVSIAPDLDSLIRLIGELRQASPDVFINCTVGTWASPYWIFFADSIWRQGEDSSFSGKGNARERWINYKDSVVYDRFASKSPLFPVNSLMYGGIVLGPTYNPGKMPTPAQNPASFQHEIRMAAGYSSSHIDLAITPALMTPTAWDELAEGIRWARSKQAVMVDSHWIGGDPRKNEIYGFAAWHPQQGGVLTLRNPDDQPQTILIKPADVFELPVGAETHYEMRSPWKADAHHGPIKADANVPLQLTLQPFEVITLETQPLIQ
jgi:hypothetical protein